MIEAQTRTFSVSELNQCVKHLLENTFETLSVTGEISNLSQPSSGHAYFTLKDAKAQIRCAYFKTHQTRACLLQNGMQIIVKGKLSLFEARGDYQLIVHQLEEVGSGSLHLQFDALKKKLLAEGLFDEKHKRPVPSFPHTIGLITSPKSAALRDLLITLYKRFPVANIIIYPSEVQGAGAAAQLSKAIQQACNENQADVLLLARGGGSLEDLWAFNDEALARTIFHATVPIVTGIGHETDFTIADFVSDYRAATPTAAAAAVTPDQRTLHQRLQHLASRLIYFLTQQFVIQTKHLASLDKELKYRTPALDRQTQTLDYLEQRLTTLMSQKVTDLSQRLTLHTQALNTLSPLETLSRGYAIATQDGVLLTDSENLQANIPIELLLARGKLLIDIS